MSTIDSLLRFLKNYFTGYNLQNNNHIRDIDRTVRHGKTINDRSHIRPCKLVIRWFQFAGGKIQSQQHIGQPDKSIAVNIAV